jgi:hypothetical protein
MSDLKQSEPLKWERQAEESAKAFAAFRAYREMGPSRSIERVHQECAKSSRLLKRWSSRYSWVARAEAYDGDIAEKERIAKDDAINKEMEKWAERRIATKEVEWKKAELLDEKAAQMLKFPLQEVEHKEIETLDDGRTLVKTTIIKPVRFSVRDAAIMVKVADDLRRNSCDMETGRMTVQGTGDGGAIVVEDYEAKHRKRWMEALPAIIGMLRVQGLLSDGDSGHAEEVKEV